MTQVQDTTNTTGSVHSAATGADGTGAAPQTANVAYLDVDPRTLLVDRNVRDSARLDKAFLASIKTQGVLVPIVTVRTTDAALRVRYGHRRTLAAIEAGQATVPVVVAADEATDDAAQVERLVGQYAENEHRTGLTTGEKVGVVDQLARECNRVAARFRVVAPVGGPCRRVLEIVGMNDLVSDDLPSARAVVLRAG